MGGGAGNDGVAEIGEVLGGRPCSGRHPDQPARTIAVVEVLVGLVADCVRCQGRVLPLDSEASDVLRQMRSLPSAALTLIGRSTEFALYMVPVSEFSGPCPRSPNRGSRQVAVGVTGSIWLLAHVSL